MRNPEFLYSPHKDQGSEQKRKSQWWDRLPQNEPIRVIIMGKGPDIDDSLSVAEKRSQALEHGKKTVKEIVEYMENKDEIFPGFTSEGPVSSMEALGCLAISATPVQCEDLISSGFVEVIIQDQEVYLIE